VIAAYGEPKGSSKAGPREVLSYETGRVIMVDGVVDQFDFKGAYPGSLAAKTAAAESAARAAFEAAQKAATKLTPSAPLTKEGWVTDYEEAKRLARTYNKKVLALFTGSDWCPPCMDFEANVANSREFLDFANPRVVLLRLDFPNKSPQLAALRAQNEALRDRVGITGYPSFVLMDTDGTVLRKLRTTGSRNVATQQAYFVEALKEGLEGKGEDVKGSWAKKPLIALGLAGVFMLLGWYWSKRAHRR
jgi:thiol-disulfide isomerase/thioredoxin